MEGIYMFDKNMLPLGSVVILEEGMQKLIIIGRGVIYDDPELGEERFADYVGVLYPTGFDPNATIFFQAENIDKIIFKGYSDEDEIRFKELYHDWESKLTIPKKKL